MRFLVNSAFVPATMKTDQILLAPNNWLEIVTPQTSTTTNTELKGCRSPWQHQRDVLLLKVSAMPIIKNTVEVIQCFLISNVLKEDELSRFVVGLIGLVLPPSVCRRSIRGRSLKIFH